MIHAWVDAASANELEELVDALDSSHATVYQLSQGHRNASPARALQLELVSQAMRKSNPRLPELVCGDASVVCRRCPHFIKSVGKDRALAAEFGPVGGAS
jgi:hypothetical protein